MSKETKDKQLGSTNEEGELFDHMEVNFASVDSGYGTVYIQDCNGLGRFWLFRDFQNATSYAWLRQ